MGASNYTTTGLNSSNKFNSKSFWGRIPLTLSQFIPSLLYQLALFSIFTYPTLLSVTPSGDLTPPNKKELCLLSLLMTVDVQNVQPKQPTHGGSKHNRPGNNMSGASGCKPLTAQHFCRESCCIRL
eukprot:TRINITY_DN22070_c0_g1_i1.p1 TRINITY_DN22070_c0_g1~~TRINITY_DN22070_c0_g1_i1.p1  ORF type:complete len:126 (-),score=5.85 TRINITY_DN22070_c0_g1_i1:32-409(-)